MTDREAEDPVPLGEVVAELMSDGARELGYVRRADGSWRRPWWRRVGVWLRCRFVWRRP
jgi:hypothetical protein